MRKISSILMILIIISLGTRASANLPANRNVLKDGYIEGYFIGYSEGIISIEEYSGKLYSLALSPDAIFEIDGRPVKITDFKQDMEVYGRLQGRRINYMDGFSVDKPGYIQAGEKFRVGTIKAIDRDQIQILLPTGKEETYFISPTTIISKNKLNVKANALYVGDRVKLYFDDLYTSYISRLEIEGESILIKDLYRGTLTVVDGLADVISLENIDVFRNGDWKSLGTGLRLPYNSDLPLYVGGQKVNYENLKYYRGRRVYMAMKDYFGQEKVEKMVVKAQNETVFSDKIDSINWFSSQLELANKKNINFHDGTMVIKSGRLVDSNSLNPKSDGLFITDGRGNDLTADVVYIYNEDINNSNIGQDYIYAGRLDKILQNEVYLRDFFLLDKNDWRSFSDDKELFYDNDTFIYNMEDGKRVSSKEFFASEFSVDEDNTRNRKPRDWYGYLYTDGDRISTIFVKKSLDSLYLQRTTTGIVEMGPSKDIHMGWTIKVRDAKDWSSIHEEWMMKNSSLDIYLKEAMIIRDGKNINIEDIRVGDRLYFLRDSNMAKVVIVK